MRDIVYMPVDLIKQADNEYWLRSLAYFTRLKSLYKNNTHYNYSLRSLSEAVGCSPACLSFHLKVLIEKGLISNHHGNITFLGYKKLREKYNNKKSFVGVPVNKKNQYDILRGQIIRFNLTAQAYNIRKSGVQIKVGNVPYNFTEKARSCYVGLSAAGIGGLFELSQASGSRIRKKLNKLGQFRCKRVFSVLHRNVSYTTYKKLLRLGDIPIYSKYRDGIIEIERRMKMEYIGYGRELEVVTKK